MANRMLRDTTDSEKVNSLSSFAEVLFYRLMMKADDYGNYHANIKLIKANCYPFKADIITDIEITACLNELLEAMLIKIYSADGKQYLNILNFGQRLRNKKKKFPDCPIETDVKPVADNSPQSAAKCPSEIETEVEVEDEVETETEREKKFLMPEMLKEWKNVFPKYPEKKEKDFPALREIAEFIAEKQNVDCDIGIMPLFKQLSEYISKHDFYKNYSLNQVSRHIQNIVNSINNGQGNSKSGKHVNGENLRERVNQAFAKRHTQQQNGSG